VSESEGHVSLLLSDFMRDEMGIKKSRKVAVEKLWLSPTFVIANHFVSTSILLS
jgi:hypothetical protein